MTDLRDKVKGDRGLIKNIEMAIPGFRGYRKREDLRIADRLLREELANRFSVAATHMEGVRSRLAKRNALDVIEDAGALVSRVNASIQRLKVAEQGYTGISPDYRIEENQLNQMYEWDLDLLDNIESLVNMAGELREKAGGLPEMEMASEMSRAMRLLEDFDRIFDRRREAIAGLTLTR